jgi:hypothetical protein
MVGEAGVGIGKSVTRAKQERQSQAEQQLAVTRLNAS